MASWRASRRLVSSSPRSATLPRIRGAKGSLGSWADAITGSNPRHAWLGGAPRLPGQDAGTVAWGTALRSRQASR